MSQTEILQVLRDQPFRPFRLRLKNNLTYEIRHPDMAIVTPAAVYVGVPTPTSTDPVASDIAFVSIGYIIQLEYLSSPTIAQTNPPATNP